MIKNPKKSKDDIQEETAEKAEEIIQETAEETPCSPDAECEAEASASEETKEEEAEDKSAKELAALNDKYLRLMAEYDNFKKRTAKEKEAIYIEKQGKFKLYHPLITQRDYQKVETADFYHLVHRHSVKSLFSSLIDAGSLNKEDLDELKKIIEQVKE